MLPDFYFCLSSGLDNSFLPTKSNETDTGWDVRAAKDYTLAPFDYVKIELGFKCIIPAVYWLELRPRSSSHAKLKLNCLYGVIDQDYRNQVLFSCQWLPERPFIQTKDLKISKGDRIGQIVPVKRLEANFNLISEDEFNKLSQADRGGGFGSSNK
jgi:deoxyuridine 5'-triphosphate nucleotidohydrolase